jgi:two-component system KDP operon response regulator KdpE
MVSDFPLKVLIVDTERAVRRYLSTALLGHYTVFEAESGRDALQSAAMNHPDVVILDLSLPDMDGMDVIRCLREWSDVPVIVTSMRDREEDKVAALDAGSDDYLTKPFGVSEMMARIRAALRRAAKEEKTALYQSGELTVDLARREVHVNNRPVMLTPTEYEILRTLVNHAGRVLTHRQLIQEVWRGNPEKNHHLLRVNISNLRRKIEADPLRPDHIITEPGVGYRLRDIEKQS